jgi:hypothetical protein
VSKLQKIYRWKHLTEDGVVEEVQPFICYDGSVTYLDNRHFYIEDAYSALKEFVTYETQYSYNEFILVESFRLYTD